MVKNKSLKTESEVLSAVKKRLIAHQSTGIIIWWLRIPSGNIKSFYSGAYVKCAPKGTPDIITVVHNRKGGLSIIFFEIKKPGGKISKEQLEFFEKYTGGDIHCYVANDPKIVDVVINSIGIDRIKELPDEI